MIACMNLEQLPVGSMHQYCEDKHHTMQLLFVRSSRDSPQQHRQRKNAYSKTKQREYNNNKQHLEITAKLKQNNVLNTCVSIHFNHINTCLKSFPTLNTWFRCNTKKRKRQSVRFERPVALLFECILFLAVCRTKIESERSHFDAGLDDHRWFQCQS